MRYRVSISGLPDRYYELTISQLQGIYSYLRLAILDPSFATLQTLILFERVTEDPSASSVSAINPFITNPSVSYVSSSYRFVTEPFTTNIESYNRGIKNPILSYTLSAGPYGLKEFPTDTPQLTYGGTSPSHSNYTVHGPYTLPHNYMLHGAYTLPHNYMLHGAYTISDYGKGYGVEIKADNIAEYLGGFLLMDRLVLIAVPERSMSSFKIYAPRESETNYALVSLLYGFPLLDLPPEVVSIITSAYPRTWLRVCKETYFQTREILVSDPTISQNARHSGITMLLKKKDMSKSERRGLVIAISRVMSVAELVPFLKFLREGSEDIMDAITTKALEFGGIVEFFQRKVITLSSLEYFKYLLRTYDELYFFSEKPIMRAILNIDGYDIAINIIRKAVYAFINRVDLYVGPRTIINTLGSPNEQELLDLTQDIFSHDGIITKTKTNPITGRIDLEFKEKTVTIDLVDYLWVVISYITSNPRKLNLNKIIMYILLEYGKLKMEGKSNFIPTLLSMFSNISGTILDPNPEPVKTIIYNLLPHVAFVDSYYRLIQIVETRILSLGGNVETNARIYIPVLEDIISSVNEPTAIFHYDTSRILNNIISSIAPTLENEDILQRYRLLLSQLQR